MAQVAAVHAFQALCQRQRDVFEEAPSTLTRRAWVAVTESTRAHCHYSSKQTQKTC